METSSDNKLLSLDRLFKKRRNTKVFAVFLCLAVILTVNRSDILDLLSTTFTFLLLCCIARLVALNMTIDSGASNYLESFFDEYIPFNPELEHSIHPQSVMANIGDERTLEVLTKGRCAGYNVRLVRAAVYFDSTSWYGISNTKRYNIFEIDTNQNYHHIFLDSRRNNSLLHRSGMAVLSRHLKGNSKISLEGDVDRYFDTYISENTAADNLISLTPDKLIALRDYGSNFDVEFIGNSIYLISENRVRSVRDLLVYQRGVIKTVGNIGQNLVRNRAIDIGTIKIRSPKVIFDHKRMGRTFVLRIQRVFNKLR